MWLKLGARTIFALLCCGCRRRGARAGSCGLCPEKWIQKTVFSFFPQRVETWKPFLTPPPPSHQNKIVALTPPPKIDQYQSCTPKKTIPGASTEFFLYDHERDTDLVEQQWQAGGLSAGWCSGACACVSAAHFCTQVRTCSLSGVLNCCFVRWKGPKHNQQPPTDEHKR